MFCSGRVLDPVSMYLSMFPHTQFEIRYKQTQHQNQWNGLKSWLFCTLFVWSVTTRQNKKQTVHYRCIQSHHMFDANLSRICIAKTSVYRPFSIEKRKKKWGKNQKWKSSDFRWKAEAKTCWSSFIVFSQYSNCVTAVYV